MEIRGNKIKGTNSDQGITPLFEMTNCTVEKLLECLRNAGLNKSASQLAIECNEKKVINWN